MVHMVYNCAPWFLHFTLSYFSCFDVFIRSSNSYTVTFLCVPALHKMLIAAHSKNIGTITRCGHKQLSKWTDVVSATYITFIHLRH